MEQSHTGTEFLESYTHKPTQITQEYIPSKEWAAVSTMQ